MLVPTREQESEAISRDKLTLKNPTEQKMSQPTTFENKIIPSLNPPSNNWSTSIQDKSESSIDPSVIVKTELRDYEENEEIPSSSTQPQILNPSTTSPDSSHENEAKGTDTTKLDNSLTEMDWLSGFKARDAMEGFELAESKAASVKQEEAEEEPFDPNGKPPYR